MTGGSDRAVLEAGLGAMGLDLSAAQVDALLAYMALIQKWNKVYNLTALRSSDEMLTHHLLDSLSGVLPLRAQLECARASDGISVHLQARIVHRNLRILAKPKPKHYYLN